MSDIQRWDFISFDPTFGPHMRKAHGGTMAEWVAYADHLGALAAARIEWEMTNGPAFDFARGQSVGFTDGVKAARDAIPDNDHRTDLDIDDYDTATEYGLAIAKAAIDALTEDR